MKYPNKPPIYLLLLSIVVLLIYSCKSRNKELINFDPRTLKEKEIKLSQIADRINYIPLENRMIIGDVQSIEMTNEAIYLSSRNIGILAFNKEGKFISKIGSIGRGPGEYISYDRYSVNNKSGNTYIADSYNIIKVYSRNGQFIRSFSLDEYGTNIDNIKSYNSNLFIQYALQFENAKNEWVICDTLGDIIKKQNRHLPEFITNWGGKTGCSIFENQLLYFNEFTDTVFSVLPDLTEKASLIISPGEHRKPRSNLSIEQIVSGKFMDLNKIFETSRFFILSYNYVKKHFLALLDKHTGETFLIPFEVDDQGYFRTGIKNDVDYGTWFFPDGYFTDNGEEYLLGIQYPSQIKASVMNDEFKNSYSEKKKYLENLAGSIKETDNPVLVLVKLKK